MFGERDVDLPAPNAWAWSFPELLAWLQSVGAKIELVNGGPSVTFPRPVDPDEQRKALAQMRRYRGLLIDHYLQTAEPLRPARERDGVARKPTINPETGEYAAQERNRVLSEMRANATEARKPLLFLLRDGHIVPESHAARRCTVRMRDNTFRKYRIEPSREATHVCLKGAAEWVRLPKVTSVLEDAAIAPKNRKKRNG